MGLGRRHQRRVRPRSVVLREGTPPQSALNGVVERACATMSVLRPSLDSWKVFFAFPARSPPRRGEVSSQGRRIDLAGCGGSEAGNPSFPAYHDGEGQIGTSHVSGSRRHGAHSLYWPMCRSTVAEMGPGRRRLADRSGGSGALDEADTRDRRPCAGSTAQGATMLQPASVSRGRVTIACQR